MVLYSGEQQGDVTSASSLLKPPNRRSWTSPPGGQPNRLPQVSSVSSWFGQRRAGCYRGHGDQSGAFNTPGFPTWEFRSAPGEPLCSFSSWVSPWSRSGSVQRVCSNGEGQRQALANTTTTGSQVAAAAVRTSDTADSITHTGPQHGSHGSEEAVHYSPSALQRPDTDSAAMLDGIPETAAGPARPSMYNRPRRLSNMSNASRVSSSAGTTGYTTSASRESFESRMRSSSFSSHASFESFESIQSFHSALSANSASPPPSHGWPGPAQLRPPRKKAKPGEQFAALPGEVLELVMAELRKLHLGPGSTSCATCWMRDCCSVMISARKWRKFARAAL